MDSKVGSEVGSEISTRKIDVAPAIEPVAGSEVGSEMGSKTASGKLTLPGRASLFFGSDCLMQLLRSIVSYRP